MRLATARLLLSPVGRTAAAPWAGCGRSRPWLLGLIIALSFLPLLWGAAAAGGEPVAVRAATHPGFGRLVFEWPAAIEVESRRSANQLVLRFARPFAADLGASADRLGGYLVELAPGSDDREVVLRLASGIGAELEIHDGRIVVVDLRAAAAASAAVELRTGIHDRYVRIVLDWAVPIGFETAGTGRRWRIVFDREGQIDAATIRQRFGDLLDEALALRGGGRSELVLALKAGVSAEVFELEGDRVVVDLYRPGGAPPAASAEPRTEPGAAPATLPASPVPPPPLPQPAAAPAPAAAALPLALRISAAEVERGVALDLDWSSPVAAAFVLRAGHLWSVFAPPADQPGAPVLPPLASPVPGWLGPGERVDASGGIAIRFPLRRPLAVQVERDGGRWRVILDTSAAPPRPARVERRQQPPRLRIAADEPVRLVRLIDPEVGDRLEFWPLLAPGLGQPRAQRLVDVELLASAQGLAWRAQSDRVEALAIDGAVELLAPDGLRLSAVATTPPAAPPAGADRAAPPVAASAAPEGDGAEEQALRPTGPETRAAEIAAPDPPGLAGPPPAVSGPTEPALLGPALERAPGDAGPLGLARFAGPGAGTLSEQRAAWQNRVARASAAQRSAARLDLARWFLAQAMAAEALAVLAISDQPGPAEAAQELARVSLTGAAELLMGRLEAAAAGLGSAALDDDPEGALWRAALAAAHDDWSGALRQLERSGSALDSYPPALQLRLGLAAARVAIEAGDDDLSRAVLARLEALDLHPTDRARVAFVEGLAHARRGTIDRAAEIWRRLDQGPNEVTRFEAAYARTQILLEADRLSPSDALAALAPARALWRGHPAEFGMLDGLAELYRQSGAPAAAIRIWQDLLARFPSAPGAARVAARSRESFASALLAEDGAALGAVQAYALFRDFPELLQDQGALGDRLRRELAARLAEVDLIDPAAALLDPLIEQRLSGPGKAEAGAELAELRLRAPDPAAALAALDRSRVADELPDALSTRRRVLRARALAAAGRPDAALALLDGRPGRSEQLAQADILWQTRAWPRLVDGLEGLLAERDDPQAPLSAEEQDLVLRLALAHVRQAEPGALERLRARFGAAMHGQAAEPAFLMATLAGPANGPGRAVEPAAALAAAAERVSRVRDYLDAEPRLR